MPTSDLIDIYLIDTLWMTAEHVRMAKLAFERLGLDVAFLALLPSPAGKYVT